MNKNQYGVPHPDGGWQVKGEGNFQATVCTHTQKDAIERVRSVVQNQGSELIIHWQDGMIREKVPQGRDPFPPRG